MTSGPTPPSELAEATARRFELEAELVALRAQAEQLQRELRLTDAMARHWERLVHSARLVSQFASHQAAAKALRAARQTHPGNGTTWRAHLQALAEEQIAAARALRPQLVQRLGEPGPEPTEAQK